MTLQGFDASSYQKVSSWSRVKSSPYSSFVVFRAILGATDHDSTFVNYAKQAEAQGIPTFAYGVAYPRTSTAIAEADAIVQLANSVGGIHALVLDVEGGGVPSSVSVCELTQYILDWMNRVQSHGYVPILYTGASFLRSRINASLLRSHILWLAEYGVSSPSVINGWHPTFWQHTSSGHVTGINGNVDLDVFYGSKSDLQTLLNGGLYVATVLKQGDSGAEVKTLQMDLNKLMGTKIATDGAYGPQTVAAVKAFEQIHKLSVDGEAGPKVLGEIQTLLKAQAPKPAPTPSKPALTPAPSQPAPTVSLPDAFTQAEQAFTQQLAQIKAEAQQQVADAEKQVTDAQAKAKTINDAITNAQNTLKGVLN